MSNELHKRYSPRLAIASDSRAEGQHRRWTEFVDALEAGTVAVVYHGDLDGAMGGAYLRRALTDRGFTTKAYWVATEEYHFEHMIRWLGQIRPTACVFSDISIENSVATLRTVAEMVTGPVIVCDHHYASTDQDLPSKVLVANPTPRLQQGETPVPTFVLADIVAASSAMYLPEWLLILAIFAEGVDEFYRAELANLRTAAFGNYPLLNREFYRRSGLQRATSLIRAEFSTSNKGHHVIGLLDRIISGQIRTFEEFKTELERSVGGLSSAIGRETSQVIDDWAARIAKDPSGKQLVVVPVESEYSIAGPVASVLRAKFLDRIVAAFQIRDGYAIIEIRARNDGPHNLPEALKRVSYYVPVVNSGGHPSAAGALIAAADVERFFDRLTEEIPVS